jgi:Periplasmic binding protein
MGLGSRKFAKLPCGLGDGNPAVKFRSMRCIAFAWLICGAWIAHSTSADSAEPIRIGAVLPFSGGVELYGRQARLGLDLAVKDINAAGGILGRPTSDICFGTAPRTECRRPYAARVELRFGIFGRPSRLPSEKLRRD